jgi:molybdate transport system ATP-binding protein
LSLSALWSRRTPAPGRGLAAPLTAQDGAGGALDVRLRKRYAAAGDPCFQLETEFRALPGVTILLGHSGAGKTTLLRCIAGLTDPEEGRIAVGERVLFDAARGVNLEPARRKVAFVFQDLALFPHLTVQENVAYGLRRLDAPERERRTSSILESFQIPHLRGRRPREISGGEQQRVALARSLVTEPAVLLLDEPLTSLDGRTKAGIIDDLRAWNEARHIPMLYVTHDHEEVFALGEQVIALEHGRIVSEGLPLDVVPGPRRETMAQFAGFENLFDATVTGIRQQEGTMTCRLAGTSLELVAPLTRAPLGAEIRLGVRAGEILLASTEPEMVSACNVIRGRVKRLERVGDRAEVWVDCGAEFRVDLTPSSVQSSGLEAGREAWMIVRPHSCHLVRGPRLGMLQRLFVFVCSGNTSRSPIAQAVCNAEIARRLKVPLRLLGEMGVEAASAGLSAEPGAPMAPQAQHALRALGVPAFEHTSRNLTVEMVEKAEAIFCMTEKQRRAAVERFPQAAAKTHCLCPDGDLDDPKGSGPEVFLELARRIQTLVRQRLNDLGMAEV